MLDGLCHEKIFLWLLDDRRKDDRRSGGIIMTFRLIPRLYRETLETVAPSSQKLSVLYYIVYELLKIFNERTHFFLFLLCRLERGGDNNKRNHGIIHFFRFLFFILSLFLVLFWLGHGCSYQYTNSNSSRRPEKSSPSRIGVVFFLPLIIIMLRDQYRMSTGRSRY